MNPRIALATAARVLLQLRRDLGKLVAHVEEHQDQLASVIGAEDAVGAAARSRRLVFEDADAQRRRPPRLDAGDRRRKPPIDDALRQMPEQIDDTRPGAELMVNINGRLVHRDEAGVSPFDSAVQGGDAFDGRTGRASYIFNPTIAGIEQADALLIVGSNPRKEAAVLNARIRKRWRSGQLKIGVIGAKADLTYGYDHLGAGISHHGRGGHRCGSAHARRCSPLRRVGGILPDVSQAAGAARAHVYWRICGFGGSVARLA